MTVDAIKKAITELPDNERLSLASWLNRETMDEWDKAMERDFAPGGRGMKLVEKVNRQIAEGKTRPLDEGLAQRRRQRR